MIGELRRHPLANVLIDALPLEIAARPRVAIERAGPPVEHALPRVADERAFARQHRREDIRGGAERFVEKERLADADEKLDALAIAEPVRVEAPQPIAGVQQIVGRGAVAKPLEKRA